MSELCYIYRDFDQGEQSFSGSIELFLLDRNRIKLIIDGLQDNSYIDYHSQAIVIIDYPKMIPLYNIIQTILDKITEDHRYKLRDNIHKDFIIRKTSCGSSRMDFNQETIQYLSSDNMLDNTNFEDDSIILNGSISEDGSLKYDYPIVGLGVDQEYYRVTRGKRVWDIGYDEDTQRYYENNWEEVVKTQKSYIDAGDYENAVYYGKLVETKKFM
jgi:hypothetical protein